ncbi:MAG: sigma-B regulation protein RsbQ [Roseivirga sp.]|jgi:sigma-B regulation protein RsbQ
MGLAVKRNKVKISGSGDKVMLFAHGFGCDQNMWRFITPAFEENYKIVLFDHVGSGKSDLSAYDYEKYDSLEGYADDIIEFCNELSLKDIIFVGHSVSAMIGVHSVIKEPTLFKELIMIGPSPRYINDKNYVGGFREEDINELLESMDSNYLGWSRSITPAIMGNPDKPELAEELNNSFCQNDPEIAKHFAKVTFLGDERDYLKRLSIDTLILQCSSDIIAPIEVGKYVHESVTGSKLTILDATGHCPHLSAPTETIQAINDFLLN